MNENGGNSPLRPGDERPESVRILGEQYAERQRALENYILPWFIAYGLLRRLGVDPFTRRGRLGTGLFFIVLCLGLPLAVTTVVGRLAVADVQRWALVGTTYSVAGVLLYRPYSSVLDSILCLHRAMADESGLRRLMAWAQRWYNVRITVLVEIAFAAGTLALVFSMQPPGTATPISVGTILVGAMLLAQLGEIAYYSAMLGVESHILVGYDYELYRLSPIYSIPLRRSLAGYNRLVSLNSAMATLFIIEFAMLLPGYPSLIVQIALVLLVVTYLTVGVGLVLPRLAIKRIIQTQKERDMEPLQQRLNDLSTRLAGLTKQEYEEMKRLKETHDQICQSSEDVLPITAVLQIGGSLLIPTVTFLAAVVAEVRLTSLLERFMR